MKIKRVSKIKTDQEIRLKEIMSDSPRGPEIGEDPNVYIGTYQSLDKYPKEFFHQFHTVACDESHQAKATTLKSILSRTFKHAYHRFGVSGTFPTEESLEILSIQSVLGPIITEVSADELVKRGAITAMSVKVVVMNHNEKELSEKLNIARKTGAGAEVFRYEKDFIQASDKRLSFIKKLVAKCDKNTLLLFHTIEYGKRILDSLSKEFTDKEFYYIDGEVSGKKREEIKKLMERSDMVEYTILNFGTYEVEVESSYKILLSDGSFKNAGDITSDDDIDDNFIERFIKKR
jgi:superfamily II DNA or RNA helicase